MQGGPQRIRVLLGLIGRLSSSAVVPYKFSLWKLSPSICTSWSWHKIFIGIKLTHCSTSKLVDRLHSFRVMQDKLDGRRMMQGGRDSRSRETSGHSEAPLSLPYLPCDPSGSLSLPGSLCRQLKAPSCEKEDYSHVGLIKYSQCHSGTRGSLLLAGLSQQTLAASLWLFLLSFSMESWHYHREVLKPPPPLCQISAQESEHLLTNTERV